MRSRGGLRRRLRVVWSSAIALAAGSASAVPLLYVANEDDPLLHVVDAANAATLSSHTVSLAGETVLGTSGLARNPVTGTLYALLWLDGQAGRELVTLDESAGNLGNVLARVGDTGDLFSALAFDASGALYGLTHDDAATPATLYTLSLGDASATFSATLGSGGFGEALGYDPASDAFYHASGYPGDQPLFERVEPGSPSTGLFRDLAYDEVLGLTSDGAGRLYMTDFLGQGLWSLDPSDGSATRIGDLDIPSARGIALVPEPSTALLLALGLVALGARRQEA